MKTRTKVISITIMLSLLLGLFSFYSNLINHHFFVLAQNQITVEQARQKVEKRFESYGIEEIKYRGVGQDTLATYNFNVKFENKDEFCVQVTKDGGYILTIGCVSENISSLLKKQLCLKAVEEFVHQIGFTDLRAIWSTSFGDETVVNLAPVIKDVIIYPDLLKVRVNCKTGDILNLEARSYLYDYYRGSIESLDPILTYEEAIKSVPEGYEIVNHRLALILDPKKTKALTYEIETKHDNLKYYFYIDAISGEIDEVLTAIA